MIKLNVYTYEKLVELLKEACSKEAIYWTERKQYQETDELVTSIERDEIVSYLLEVCERDDVLFSVETFSLFVTLLDRFLASYKVKSKYLECLAVACLYIASKVKEEDDNISITSEFLLDCDAKCSISELLRMELMVLTKFEWNVNDTTHCDFLHIYYAMIVDKYRELEKVKPESEPRKLNIWKYKHAKSFKLDNSIEEQEKNNKNKSFSSSYPPIDLDFLHELETQLKQCLCINELTNSFRPHILAYSLLSIQLEKYMEVNNHQKILNSINYRQAIAQTIDTLKQISKLNDEGTVDICKEKIKYHLESIETSNNLFDKYLSEYHNGVVNSFRTSLLAINTDLPAIEEVEEEDENNCVTSKNNSSILKNISNLLPLKTNNTDVEKMESSDNENSSYANYSIKDDDYDSELKKFDKYKRKSMLMNNHVNEKCLTYADILIGRTRTDGTCVCEQQKRKLSENSSVSDNDEILEELDDYYYEDDDDDFDNYENDDDDLKDDNFYYEYDSSKVRLN